MTIKTHSLSVRRSAIVAVAVVTVCMAPLGLAIPAGTSAPGPVVGHQGRQDSTLDDDYRKAVNHGIG